MTVVVADTSPINYLILIIETEILPQLYQRIVIPGEVFAELIDDGAPPEVREWTKQHPPWVEIKSAPRRDAVFMELDEGEAAGIALAEAEVKTGVLLLIDETAGRLEATRRGIPNTGTLGVPRRAAIENLIDLLSALHRLGAKYSVSEVRTRIRVLNAWGQYAYRKFDELRCSRTAEWLDDLLRTGLLRNTRIGPVSEWRVIRSEPGRWSSFRYRL